jgi:hypothetical protein
MIPECPEKFIQFINIGGRVVRIALITVAADTVCADIAAPSGADQLLDDRAGRRLAVRTGYGKQLQLFFRRVVKAFRK